MLLIPVAGFAASGDEFYQRLYQRGMAHFAAGDYSAAFTELRNAAFGFVEQVDKFETAQSYAVIAANRLGRDNDVRDSLLRIVSAEKVQPHFRSVALPDEIRAEIDTVAARLLTSQECTLLGVPTSVQEAAATKPAAAVPTPTKRPNVAVTAPHEKQSDDDKELSNAPPKPQPVAPAPQPRVVAPQPVVPAPQPVAPAPQPVVPVPQPVAPSPQPVDPPPQPQPKPVQQPTVPPKQETPQPAVKNADTSLAEAQRAIDNGEIGRARSIYNTLATGPALSHASALRVAEGLFGVRDFAGAARAFQRAGALGHGEEGYHYSYAVALYETGRYAEAKRELAASLPFITATADVARYRAKIEGAIE